jgi:NAD(P)-dependent dehydrogenase (short-subunit alcohol dehydrogenase family)
VSVCEYVANIRGSGIGLETSILFAKEGANVLMADISEPALQKAKAKLLQLVPSASRVETVVCVAPLLDRISHVAADEPCVGL